MRTGGIFAAAGVTAGAADSEPHRQADRALSAPSLPLAPALAVTLALTLAGCSPSGPPVPNPHPVRMVRVTGALDPSLDVRVFTRHFTAARKCRRAENLLRRLDGKTQPRSAWVESAVQRDDGGYAATVILDHLDPGECGWHPFVIAFQVSTDDGLSTGRVVAGADGQRRLEPEPESRIWIDSDAAQAARRDGRPAGHQQIAPLELACRQHAIHGVAALSCLPEIPRGLALLSEQATEVRVDFRDRTGVGR